MNLVRISDIIDLSKQLYVAFVVISELSIGMLARISQLVNNYFSDFRTFYYGVIIAMTKYEIYCALRDEKGVKDKTVADAVGITRSTFSDWKSGRSEPKADKMIRIAEYFGVSYSYLMGLSPERNTPKGLIDLTPTIDLIMQAEADKYDPDLAEIEDAVNLYERYKNAPAHVQAAIETLLKSEKQEP